MAELQVGHIRIPYSIERTDRVRRKVITVTAEAVTVRVPTHVEVKEVEDFLERKRSWIYDKYDELRSRQILSPWPERFMSGSKVLYLGRRMPLTVDHREGISGVRYDNGIVVRLGDIGEAQDRQCLAKKALEDWYRVRLQTILHEIVRKFAAKLRVEAPSFRIRLMVKQWGDCSARGHLSFHPHLIFAPRATIEYVVVHELCHLIHRNHDPEFWQLVRRQLPDYVGRMAWLERDGSRLVV